MSWHQLYTSRMANRYPKAFNISLNIFSPILVLITFIRIKINSISIPGLPVNPAAGGASGNVVRVAIGIGISEVVLFVMYQVFAGVITSINLTGVFKGTNGVLVGLVTLFYLLGAALTPLALVKHAGFL